MSKSAKFFRYLWRVNAVLILVAAGAVTLGVGGLLVAQFGTRSAIRREAELGPAVAGPHADPRLVLGQASRVPGSQVLRAQLILSRAEGSFSSGGYSEVRNILYERDRHLVLAQADPASFTKRKEREVAVPQLK